MVHLYASELMLLLSSQLFLNSETTRHHGLGSQSAAEDRASARTTSRLHLPPSLSHHHHYTQQLSGRIFPHYVLTDSLNKDLANMGGGGKIPYVPL